MGVCGGLRHHRKYVGVTCLRIGMSFICSSRLRDAYVGLIANKHVLR